MFEIVLEQLRTFDPSLAAVVTEASVVPQGKQVSRILQEHGMEERCGPIGHMQDTVFQAALSKHGSLVKTLHAMHTTSVIMHASLQQQMTDGACYYVQMRYMYMHTHTLGVYLHIIS